MFICIPAELGSVFFSVKEKNFDERGNRRQTDREFSKKAELETEIARTREAYVFFCFFPLGAPVLTNVPESRSNAQKAAEEALAEKISSGSASKIIVPGTPRHSGIGAGSRVTQTPRRRTGI